MEINKRNIRILSMAGSRGACARVLSEIVERDGKCVIMSADLAVLSGLEKIAREKPEQFVNVGIAEQNLVGVAAGMARDGRHVVITTYANFLTMRACEQVRMNFGYMKLPVVLLGSSGGLGMGVLGNTHYAIEDIAIMRAIPNIMVLSPADGVETVKAIEAATNCGRPVYIRLSGEMNQPIVYREDYEFSIGHMIRVREGEDIAIFATGSMVHQSMKAAEEIAKAGIRASVINIHTIKPLNREEIWHEIKDKNFFVTIEEHSVIGGLGSAVLEALADKRSCAGLRMGIPDTFLKPGSYEYLLEQCGLGVSQIAEKIVEFWDENKLKRGAEHGF